jgi:dTDP-4-amino-4,6-dideoxygalactose transaminase
MTDIQAAVGREQLKRLADIVDERRSLVRFYKEVLSSSRLGIACQHEPDACRSNWQSLCIRLPAGIDQLEAMQHMLDRGVSTRRGVMCAHLEPAYADAGPHADLSISESAQRRCILLPLFPSMTSAQQQFVVDALLMARRP